MTIAEYSRALKKLNKDKDKFQEFKKIFGGDAKTIEDRVTEFVHHPEYERRICQLLGLVTQEERLVQASRKAGWAAMISAACALLSILILILNRL